MSWPAIRALRAEADVRTAARCPLVLGPGVFCLRGTGSLTKLATLRRPVILRLSEAGREAWGVLLGINDSKVRLAIGGETFDTDWHALERAWLGEYYVIWRAPEFMAGTFRRGDSGPAVEWLEAQIASGEGGRSDGLVGPAYYDGDMEAAVRSVQAAHGLIPDGIVGPETLLALSSRERGGPRVELPRRHGFGREVIERGLCADPVERSRPHAAPNSRVGEHASEQQLDWVSPTSEWIAYAKSSGVAPRGS